jgi:hypothetical protein
MTGTENTTPTDIEQELAVTEITARSFFPRSFERNELKIRINRAAGLNGSARLIQKLHYL